MNSDEIEFEDPIPRDRRTPITEAGSALNSAYNFWIELFEELKKNNPNYGYSELADPGEFFFKEIFREAWNDPETSGDKSIMEIRSSCDGNADSEIYKFALLKVMDAIVCYSVQAMKAETSGKHDEAWTYTADAQYWAGILTAEWGEKKYSENPAAEMARRRHAENYALTNEAIRYFREKIDPSLSAQKAATELVKFVPLSHKKLAEIVSAEKKKQS